MPTPSFAENPSLTPVHPSNLGITEPDGYDIDLDQIFKVNGKGFEGKKIFFADGRHGGDHVPKIFVPLDRQIIDFTNLPGIESGWHLDAVKAVSIDGAHADQKHIRILAVLTFEPLSGPRDACDQSMVIDILANGKISFDHEINHFLQSKDGLRIKTISALKNFLHSKADASNLPNEIEK